MAYWLGLAPLMASRSAGQAISSAEPLSWLGLAWLERAQLLGLAGFQAGPAEHYRWQIHHDLATWRISLDG